MGDRIEGILYQMPSFSLGNYSRNEITVGIYPPLDDYGIDGLLSQKFLKNQPFQINLENGSLKLLSDQEAAQAGKDNLVIPLTLNIKRDIALSGMYRGRENYG